MLSAGQTFAGYRIERLLGAGGMGEVYLAAHPRLPRRDAVKVLPAELTADPVYRARFTREADLAARLDHPSIVSVYDRGEESGQLWIAMKYVPGEDAEAMLRRSGPLVGPDAGELVTAVADALDYAHAHGMIHRDVKPANILIDATDATRRKIYLSDFGVARTMANNTALTAANLTVGSIQYASPEQLRGVQLDGRSDQYALACTAFRLLTGRPPFPLATPTDIITAHLQAPPPRVSAHRPELSAAVDDVLARAMAKDPAARYESCARFAGDLATALRAPGPGRSPSAPSPAYAPTMLNTPSPEPPQRPTARYTAPGAPDSEVPPGYSPYPQSPAPGWYGPPPGLHGGAGPAQAPPIPGHGGTGGLSGRTIALIALGVVIVLAALAVGAYFLFRDTSSSSPAAASTSRSSSSSVSADSSASPTPATDPRVVGGVPTECTVGRTTSTQSTTTIRDGDIWIPEEKMPRGWRPDTYTSLPYVTSAAGVTAARPEGTRGWAAQITVGTLPADFTGSTEAIARKFLSCLPENPGYDTVSPSPPSPGAPINRTMEDRVTEYTLIRARISVSGGPSRVTGDDIVLVVVGTTPKTLAFGASPTGDARTSREVETAVTGLLTPKR
ncbi:serine/threonine protein kinase [Gordonia shandongensis]|uniref:serine/threonine protein kinase n=1 Tax=Gordonia shandongensis TaxID=376351 RepID=UPI0004790074|nr:serine/threonine-protein kinase [Gordonia shandongensis]